MAFVLIEKYPLPRTSIGPNLTSPPFLECLEYAADQGMETSSRLHNASSEATNLVTTIILSDYLPSCQEESAVNEEAQWFLHKTMSRDCISVFALAMPG